MNLENFIRTLSMMYTAHDNETRRTATMEIMRAEDQMSPDEVLRIGVELFRVTDYGAAVQAYGAVLLRRALVSGRIGASAVPYNEIMMWYFNEPTLGRLLCGDLVDLITECIVHEWPDRCPDLMNQVCPPQAGLSQQPRKVRLLCLLVSRCMEPHLGKVPVQRMKKLKNAMTECGRRILVEVIQALFDMYTAAGGEGSRCCAEGTSESVVDCLTIVVNLAPSLKVSQWWEVGLGNALSVLVHWQPMAHEALAATTALLRCDVLSSGTVSPELSVLLGAALGSVDVCLAERSYGTLDEIADLLHEMPDKLIQSVAAPVSQACLVMLAVPSISLASTVCSVLKRLGDDGFSHFNPLDFMARIAVLVPKNKCRPETGTDREGVLLSEQQFGSAELFERGFAEFRSLVGGLLSTLARIYPVVANQFITQLLTTLCDGRGVLGDPRTSSGFVTQQSNTFCQWEASQFLIDHLSESFKYSSDYVGQAIEALVEHQTEDMVLCPVFLNMLSYFWNCRDDVAQSVWERTLNIIFSCLDRKNYDRNDIDVMSARKRAVTLLVNACSQHAVRLSYFCDPFMRRMERLLMLPSTTAQERTLLYEATAALTSALPPEEGERRLQSIFSPILKMLERRVDSMTQGEFNNIIIGDTQDYRDERNMIRDGVTVVAGVLRRCKTSPYIVESSTALAPYIMRLLEFIHGIRVEELPPAYAGILDMGIDEREQYLPGHSRRSAHPRGAVQRARQTLLEMRMSLYQVVGGLSAFLPAEALRGILRMLGVSVQFLPTYAVRSLMLQCLFPIGSAHPELLADILLPCVAVFERRVACRNAKPEDDVINTRQLFYYSKDVFTFIRRHIVERKLLEGDIQLVQSVVLVALSVLESGANTHEASRFIFTTLDGASCVGDGTAAQLDQLAVHTFGRMLDFVTCADDTILPLKDRERLVTTLADNYLDHFPKYVTALQTRFSQTQIDELHAHLAISTRFDVKRRHFKEFLLRPPGEVLGAK
ncbi:hypothetical protein DQ04_01471080 [Trypanosoma grayi]|uniref:hypothetical protein n=1 Tax=Trypanosoma grayi TaxID=71804 RepID=UPI0004F44E23|nr:hypothetical protein DQ04_01471080 [Trypanosoma grayi]KEG12722.1 hypothetical protein DQ04_01471080 [Trypanosoma grayi]